MRSIAIPVADRKECEIALETTWKLGIALGADVVGYHVLPSKEILNEINRAELWAGANMAYPIWTAGDEAEIQKRAEAARALFKRMADKYDYEISSKHGRPGNPVALYETSQGLLEKLFTPIGSLHDLIVVSRPAKNGGQTAHAVMLSALLDASTPVLVLPQEKVNLRAQNIVVAWNGEQEEAFLVHGTLDLLKAAKKVTLVTVEKQSGKGPTGSAMTEYLAAHDIKARAVTVKGKNTGKAIEKAVDDEKADLLLCGAYSRGRMRELVFGGVTEHLLSNYNKPLIMLHV